MKKLLPLLVATFLFYSQSSKAQLAPVGTKWTFHHTAVMAPDYQEVWLITRDTIIQGATYSVLSNFSDTLIVTLDSGRVYYFMNNEKLLYFDFSAKPGDSILTDMIRIHMSGVTRQWVYISQIHYQTDFNGDSLPVFSFTTQDLNDTMQTASGQISPKIITGPFFSRHPIWALSNYPGIGMDADIRFKCYEEPGGFSYRFTNNCSTVGVEKVDVLTDLRVFPNPANNYVQVNLHNTQAGNLHVKLVDCLGRSFSESVIENAGGEVEHRIAVTEIPAGLYVIEVCGMQTKSSQKVYIHK